MTILIGFGLCALAVLLFSWRERFWGVSLVLVIVGVSMAVSGHLALSYQDTSYGHGYVILLRS